MPENTHYIISTERLGLRRWIESDVQPFIELNTDSDVMKYYPSILTAEETIAMVERIDNHFNNRKLGLFAVELKSTNQFIGYTGFTVPAFISFFTPCVEIGWRYHKNHWGNGYATEAAKACLEYGFKNHELNKIVSFTSELNHKSIGVMQRIGMKYRCAFNHPNLPEDHELAKHVLYEIKKEDFVLR